MVIKLTNQPAVPRTLAAQVRFSPRFGAGASTELIQTAAEKIPNIGLAHKLRGWVEALGINKDIRVGGLSLEDISGRLQTFFGVYLLQGYYAAKDNKHPYETNGRNAVVWLMTLALTSITKSEKWGVNTILLNPIMNKKGTHVKVPLLQFLMEKLSKPKADKYLQPVANKVVQPIVDFMRMDANYLDIIKEAGIKMTDEEKLSAMKGNKALWASSWLDTNRVEQIQNLEAKLAKDIKNKVVLTDAQKAIHDAIPGFFRRINAFNIVSTGVITVATVYFIGGVAMKIVNRVFTPLDKDGKGKDKPNTPPFFTPNAFAPPTPVMAAPRPQIPYSPITMPMTLSRPNIPLSYPVMLPNSQGGLN